jgi:dynactin complex subunit
MYNNNSKLQLYEYFDATFALKEGLTDIGGNGNTQSASLSFSEMTQFMQTNKDLSNNIYNLDLSMSEMKSRKGRFAQDIVDESGNLMINNRLVDIAERDMQTMLIQQNTMYIVGTITMATLIVTALFMTS